MYSPAQTAVYFWRWFWAGIVALAIMSGVVLGGWQAGWWFSDHNATRQAEQTQNGYSNQVTLRQQISAKLADIDAETTQIAAADGNASLIAALKAQRAAEAQIACADAAEISGIPLEAQQSRWVAANCQAGVLSPGSSLYQAGQP